MDNKGVVTAIVIALILGIPSAIWGGKQLLDHFREQKERRTKIGLEIQHRIPFARERAVDDVSLAKKRIDGVDRRYCLYDELVNVPLRKLLEDWKSAGGGEMGREIERLAAVPMPTPEQIERLLTLLGEVFPETEVTKEPAPPVAAPDRPTADVSNKQPPPHLPTKE